jgi:hypothetical protein
MAEGNESPAIAGRVLLSCVSVASSTTRAAIAAAQTVQRASVSMARVGADAPGVREAKPIVMTALDRCAARGEADLVSLRDALAPKVRAATPAVVSQLMYFVDLDAVMAQLDLAGIISAALENMDLGAVIRDSTSTVAGETARGVRTQAVGADEFVARVTDRVLRRRTPRHVLPGNGQPPETALPA